MLQERLYGSVKIISIQRSEVISRLREISQVICRKHAEVLSIHLFGSLARGDQVGTSDVDVLVVVREVGDADPPELIRRYYPYFDLPMGVDVLVLDDETIERRLQEGDSFMRRLLAERVELAQC